MTVTQMLYFTAVCNHLSFSKAANALNVTQPAISLAVRELENECNVKLFDRKKNSLNLTEEGRILLHLIQPCLKQFDELNSAAKHLDQINQCVRIGFGTLFGNYIYSGILTQFMRSHPNVQISAKEDSSKSLIQMLDSNQLDIILIPAESSTLQAPEYQQMTVSDASLCFCVSIEHPLAWNHYVTWEEIAQVPLVMLSGRFELKGSILRTMSDLGLTPRVIHYTDQVYTVERFIENNAAGGFLPEVIAARNKYISGLKYDNRDEIRFLKAVWRKDRFVSQALKDFIETMAQYAGRYTV